jgi:gamma-glutamyltranspeptidase/glutathione hydrolase
LDPDPRHLHKTTQGAVSCDVPLCSQLGVDILNRGGNAADATVTVALCVGGINMFNSGIGGGGYILSKKYDEDAIAIDAREAAPLKSDKLMFKGKEYLSKVGGLAAGIPGEVKGLYTLFKLQGSGTLQWKELIMPVVDVLRSGWNASAVLASVLELDKEVLKANYDDYYFLFKEDSFDDVIELDDLVRHKELAGTLELIASNESDAIFYDPDGPIASNLIKAANSHGGIFTREDFLEYEVEVKPALHTSFLSNHAYTTGGSSSGPALIHGLNIMNHFGEQVGGDMEPLATHHLIEAMKWMASSRSRLGDPDTNMIEFVTSAEWADYALTHINDSATLPHWSDYKPEYELNTPHGTTSFAIVDKDHNAVTITSTINLLFGSLVRDRVTGIILNNEMDDFSTPGLPNAFGVEPSVHNFIRPKKRPLSSSVPTIVVNELGKPDFIIASAGGSRILTAVFQAIVRVYSYQIPLLEAVAYPRLHHQLIPDVIEHEDFIGSDIIEALEAKGHQLILSAPKTAMNGIRRWAGDYEAVGDYWRKRAEAAVQ